MGTNYNHISEDLARKLVYCVEDAVGDGVREDIQRNDLQTKNSVPARIWDLMNTNIIKMLKTQDCTIAKAHRGPWEMLIIFEKTTQCIFTLMREKRFMEIRKQYPVTISKDQFYRIAHIGKATELYLLQSGLVSCIQLYGTS